MEFNTTKFGIIEVDDTKIINFENGLLGFEELKKYTIIKAEETKPFYWLQSLEDKSIALPCMNPFVIMPEYNPIIDEVVLHSLNANDSKKLMVITTVTVPSDPIKATTNLVAPIIINTENNKGLQYVTTNTDYNIRQPVFMEVKKC